MRTLPLIAAALLIATPIAAQESKTGAKLPAAFDSTKEQDVKIQAVLADFDKKVMAGFKGEEKMIAAMQADLKAIDTLKDPKSRAAAITAYQKKYAEPYKQALKKGGADLSSLAANLSQILKGRTFRVVDGTHLVAVTDTGDTPPAAPPPPAKQTVNLVSDDFTFQGDTDCVGIRDSDSQYRNFRLTTHTWAGVAAGCKESGNIVYTFNPVEGLSPTARIKFDMTADTSAVAVTGASWSRASVNVSLISPGAATARSLNVDVTAAILWAAEDDGEVRNAVLTLNGGRGQLVNFQSSAISRSNALGSILTGTESSSALKIHEASVVAVP